MEEEEAVNCVLRCKEGYNFAQDAVHSYSCAYDGVWLPATSSDRPDCSRECVCFQTKRFPPVQLVSALLYFLSAISTISL